jgi:hypothetical protein
MNSPSVGPPSNNWDHLLLGTAIGLLGSAVIVYGPDMMHLVDWNLQQKKVGIVFSKALFFMTGGYFGKHYPSASNRQDAFGTMPYLFSGAKWGGECVSSIKAGVTEVRMDYFKRGIDRKKNLVESKKLYQLVDGTRLLGRKISPKGDCFFLSAAVGLLEYLQANKGHLELIISAINQDTQLPSEQDRGFIERQSVFDTSKNVSGSPSPVKVGEIADKITNNTPFIKNQSDEKTSSVLLTKEGIINDLTQITFLERAVDLESYFADNKFMNNMVSLLRSLMTFAMEEEPDYEIPGGRIPTVLSKQNLYAEVLGSLDPRSKARQVFPVDDTFTDENFKTMLRILRTSQDAWPSDSCIRALCCKLGIGFTILQERGKQIEERTCVEFLPSAGHLLLSGEHYSKVYPFSNQFLTTSYKIKRSDEFQVRSTQIEAKSEELAFLSIAVAWLDSIFRNRNIQEDFDPNVIITPGCARVIKRLLISESQSELYKIFNEESSMQKVTDFLKGIMLYRTESDTVSQATALVEMLNIPLKIGFEETTKEGQPIFKWLNSSSGFADVLVFKGGRVASFFPNS